jgi:hypothetical protein
LEELQDTKEKTKITGYSRGWVQNGGVIPFLCPGANRGVAALGVGR